MAPLTLELTQLEVEVLDIVTRATEQQTSLDTLTSMQHDVAAVLTKNGTFPVNSDGGAGCCCCPIVACCCDNGA